MEYVDELINVCLSRVIMCHLKHNDELESSPVLLYKVILHQKKWALNIPFDFTFSNLTNLFKTLLVYYQHTITFESVRLLVLYTYKCKESRGACTR